MAHQTPTVLQKQLTPRSIGRLMDADFSGIIILFRLVPYESGVGPTSLSTARTLPRTTTAEVPGLNEFPKDQWPTNIPLLYFSYHVMVGLGTIFVAVMALAAFLLWRRKLYASP
jgi:hypothetical protein